jgi:transcriptional regulator with XRE-family HTH domain
MGRNLNDIIAELPPARRARIDAEYNKLKQNVESLRELRKIAGKAQADIAAALKIKQPSVSKIEKQADMYLSTLRSYVEAIGGELELVVKLPERPVLRLQHLGEALGHTPRPAKPNARPRRRLAASRKTGSVSILKRS